MPATAVTRPARCGPTRRHFIAEKGVPIHTQEVWYYEHPYPPGAKSYNKGKPIRIEEFEGERAWWGKPDKSGSYSKRVENEQAWCVSIDTIKSGNFNLDGRGTAGAGLGMSPRGDLAC